MTFDEYSALAARTDTPHTRSDMLENGLLGMAGEVGECCDHVKKYLYQGHDIDYDHIAEELGDVLWYISQTARAIGWSMDSVAQKNIIKLHDRYPDGFDEERSRNREQ